MSDRVKSEAGRFLPPAAWQFDRRLFEDLKGFWLESSFGAQLDARDWMTAEPLALNDDPTATEFWFDYLADTGDGELATYSIAWLAMSDLWVPKTRTLRKSPVESEQGKLTEPSECLPRGRLLIIGGDTAYNVADEETLRTRFHGPFVRAAKEHGLAGRPHAWLLGIPGNHDYYDALDGFNRVFRLPLQGDEGNGEPPPFAIPGFVRKQSASYFAVDLPFEWRLLGIDCELGHVDLRQKKFFGDLPSRGKCIVTTPEPAVVLGPGQRGEKTRVALQEIGFSWPFAHGAAMPPGACRLDLSGDTHRYERHFGVPDSNGTPSNYASVVSGGGGASLQPVHGQVTPVTAKLPHYPDPADAASAVTASLVNPLTMLKRTFATLVGAFLAVAVRRSVSMLTAHDSGGASCEAWTALAALLAAIALLAPGKKCARSALLRMGLADALCAAAAVLFGVGDSTRAARALGLSLALAAAVFTIRCALARSPRELRWVRPALTFAGLLAVSAAVSQIGKVAPAAELLFDALALSFAVLVAAALLLVGPCVETKTAGAGLRLLCAFLGAYHVVIQVGLPFVLVRLGNLVSVAAVVVVMSVTAVVARHLPVGKLALRWGLAATWLLQGGASFAVIFAAHGPFSPGAAWPDEWSIAGWLTAAGVGAVVACVGAGWFFATVVAFGAFAEAVGGITGVDRFKHFLRIRLRRDDITVFAIGFDYPQESGKDLELVLVDEFTLMPKG